MKTIFLDAKEYDDYKYVIQNAIEQVQNKYNGSNTYPELDEHFENEFKCTILYGRERGIIGIRWTNDADFSWFLLRNMP